MSSSDPTKDQAEDPKAVHTAYISFFSPKENAILAQRNYDESLVPPYEPADPLRFEDGTPVTTAEAWNDRRRGELLELFSSHVYGRMHPATPVVGTVTERSDEALEGKATRLQVDLTFPEYPHGPTLHLIVYLPRHAQGPVPAFLGLNFEGNHGAFTDPEIPLSKNWFIEIAQGIVDHRATEASRGAKPYRWPLEMILARGYAVATLYYGDLEADHNNGFKEGSARALFLKEGMDGRAPDEAGSITTWAWGLSRALDYLETVPEIDAGRVALTGHSRLGKTALWAAANDERFALVVANQSGCGGAALSRREFGETYTILSNVRLYWFSENCRLHSHEPDFPVDQHELIATIAPRPVLVSSAEEDLGADPKGEFLGALHASPVYRLLGTEGLAADTQPPTNAPILSRLGYFIRPGKHNITPEDWAVHLDFADRHLKGPEGNKG